MLFSLTMLPAHFMIPTLSLVSSSFFLLLPLCNQSFCLRLPLQFLSLLIFLSFLPSLAAFNISSLILFKGVVERFVSKRILWRKIIIPITPKVTFIELCSLILREMKNLTRSKCASMRETDVLCPKPFPCFTQSVEQRYSLRRPLLAGVVPYQVSMLLSTVFSTRRLILLFRALIPPPSGIASMSVQSFSVKTAKTPAANNFISTALFTWESYQS